MQLTTSLLAATALFSGLAAAHGNVTSPPARLPGPAMAKACGATALTAAQSDLTGPIENIQVVGCDAFLCRGAQLADNTANVQRFFAGQVVDFSIILPIPHEGPANVSVLDPSTNTIIGDPLIEFATYADEKLAVLPANNTAFSVTIPEGLENTCAKAGDCVLQWFWLGTAAKQTYESCVDFVIG